MADKESQEDELLALASIFDSEVFSTTVEGDGGQFAAHLDLPQPFHVVLQSNKTANQKQKESSDNSDTQQFLVEYLPPIMLYFELPRDYPSKHPPQITSSCNWLTLEQMSKLCRRLDEIWQENQGDVILFMWTSFLKDDTLEYLGIRTPVDLTSVVDKHTKTLSVQGESAAGTSDRDNVGATEDDLTGACAASILSMQTTVDKRAIQDIASQGLLLPTILEHDTQQRERHFLSTLFTCQVCFSEKLGALCMSFAVCDHVYCKDCMKGYFEVQINDGNVKALTCPSADCESEALPNQVKDLMTQEQFQRYDRLLLQSTLDTMSDIMYCPRKLCGSAVMVDSGHSMGSCPACHYTFCIFCRTTYHGISPCKIKRDEVIKLRDEYNNGDKARKAEMERRYGRRAMQQIIEESYSNEYLEREARKCPHCATWISKIDGCNKMTCTKCRTYFCWLCQARLPKQNPYIHFNNPGSNCFNQLFQGVMMEDGDDDFFMPDGLDDGDDSSDFDDDDALLFRLL